MSKTLILMRHAKSSWSSAHLADHDRSLNDRGRKSALALGDWLRAQGWKPDEILCSSARRTRETCAGLNLDIDPRLCHDLYLASPDTMLGLLKRATGDSVLMIAHNPGIAELAEALVDGAPDHPRFADYPTGATLVARFNTSSWADITPGTASAVTFITPRELVAD